MHIIFFISLYSLYNIILNNIDSSNANDKYHASCQKLNYLTSQITKSITDLYNKHCEIELKKNENDKIEEYTEKAEDTNLSLKYQISALKDKINYFNKERAYRYRNNMNNGDDDIC